MTGPNGLLEPTEGRTAPPINPEAVASPESIGAVYSALDSLIDGAIELDPNLVWEVTPSKGNGDTDGNKKQPHLRLLSLPTHIDGTGKRRGESFVSISWVDTPDGRQILITEDRGSGNPWGDVMGSLVAGAIVHRISRTDTALLSPVTAEVRKGHFTFGPARLEEHENRAQADNPFTPATEGQIARIQEIIEQGKVYNHDGEGKLPSDDQRRSFYILEVANKASALKVLLWAKDLQPQSAQ